jgi:tRNA (guanine37-N1)-methyltransferase
MTQDANTMSLFRPPIVRSAGAVLDRALFAKTIPVAAARVYNIKNVAKYRTQMEKTKESIIMERLKNIVSDPDAALASKGGKCLLLKPDVKPGGMHAAQIGMISTDLQIDPSTWSPSLKEAVEAKELGVIDYNLELGYDYWTYCRLSLTCNNLEEQI